jgi:GTPase SAR1 family protein
MAAGLGDSKIVLLGSLGSGKTSLLKRYVDGVFDELGERSVCEFISCHREIMAFFVGQRSFSLALTIFVSVDDRGLLRFEEMVWQKLRNLGT